MTRQQCTFLAEPAMCKAKQYSQIIWIQERIQKFGSGLLVVQETTTFLLSVGIIYLHRLISKYTRLKQWGAISASHVTFSALQLKATRKRDKNDIFQLKPPSRCQGVHLPFSLIDLLVFYCILIWCGHLFSARVCAWITALWCADQQAPCLQNNCIVWLIHTSELIACSATPWS